MCLGWTDILLCVSAASVRWSIVAIQTLTYWNHIYSGYPSLYITCLVSIQSVSCLDVLLPVNEHTALKLYKELMTEWSQICETIAYVLTQLRFRQFVNGKTKCVYTIQGWTRTKYDKVKLHLRYRLAICTVFRKHNNNLVAKSEAPLWLHLMAP